MQSDISKRDDWKDMLKMISPELLDSKDANFDFLIVGLGYENRREGIKRKVMDIYEDTL